MKLTLTTWNINSVRLRIDLVAKLIAEVQPDVLCLQETKCPDDAFPLKRFKQLGYTHIALNGQKGYHGVAVISKLPFESQNIRSFCDNLDSRHLTVAIGAQAGLSQPLQVHNFYVPAGGDIPDPEVNPKFLHKLSFLDEMKDCAPLHPQPGERHILVGDLNVAPHEHDVWSHKQLLKIVSHTPIECEKLLAVIAQGGWIDVARDRIPMSEKIYTWWSYRSPDWTANDRGRRLDHAQAGHRGHHAGAGAHQKGVPRQFPQALERGTDRRLVHAQAQRRARHAALGEHGVEHADQVQVNLVEHGHVFHTFVVCGELAFRALVSYDRAYVVPRGQTLCWRA
jgi:exodeoxyribonuclease-3